MNILKDPVLLDISSKIKKTPCQTALKFLVDKGVSIIPKSSIPHEIKENSEVIFWGLLNESRPWVFSVNSPSCLCLGSLRLH